MTTASEKLRALRSDVGVVGYATEAERVLGDALPLIADVVEAAEGQDDAWHNTRLGDALTALRAHLEGGDE